MSFIDNILQGLGMENLPSAPTFRATLLGENMAYFESVLSIKSYSSEIIEFSTKGGSVILKGSGLYIKKYCAGDLAVCGKIKSLERV